MASNRTNPPDGSAPSSAPGSRRSVPPPSSRAPQSARAPASSRTDLPQVRTIAPPSARPGPRARSGRPRVLVVDDSQVCLDMMAMVLEEGGYEAVTLTSPFALSSAMSQHDPDLVLVDVAMPGLPGDKLVEITLKNRRAGRGCPIVLHSDRPDAELEYLVQTSGASGHLRKTSEAEAILGGIARFVAPGEPSRK